MQNWFEIANLEIWPLRFVFWPPLSPGSGPGVVSINLKQPTNKQHIGRGQQTTGSRNPSADHRIVSSATPCRAAEPWKGRNDKIE